MPTKNEKDEAVAAWRKAHIDELQKTLDVFIGIRDDGEVAEKDRINAGLGIARLLGAVAADGRTVKAAGPDTSRPQHKRVERENIDKWLDTIE